jgi:hypothetical protein
VPYEEVPVSGDFVHSNTNAEARRRRRFVKDVLEGWSDLRDRGIALKGHHVAKVAH